MDLQRLKSLANTRQCIANEMMSVKDACNSAIRRLEGLDRRRYISACYMYDLPRNDDGEPDMHLTPEDKQECYQSLACVRGGLRELAAAANWLEEKYREQEDVLNLAVKEEVTEKRAREILREREEKEQATLDADHRAYLLVLETKTKEKATTGGALALLEKRRSKRSREEPEDAAEEEEEEPQSKRARTE